MIEQYDQMNATMSSQSSKKRSVSNKRAVTNQSINLIKSNALPHNNNNSYVDTRDYSPTQMKKKQTNKKLLSLPPNAYNNRDTIP